MTIYFTNYDKWLTHNPQDDEQDDDDFDGGLADYKYEEWLDSQYE